MAYRIKITLSASNAGKKLSPEIRQAARASLKELAENPDLGKELQAELSGFRAYRFMRYRIIYTVDIQEKNIVVWAIGHRRDIYENFNSFLSGLS
jgi:mRNA interferase RelE/StbE